MTTLRSPDLQLFITTAATAIRDGSGAGEPARVAAERIFTALQTPSAHAGRSAAARLPVCTHLPTALRHARRQPGPVSALTDAFAVIEPQLDWKLRAGTEMLDGPFRGAHANATIVGAEGLEIRPDVWIGVSLVAPQTVYPDHRHPPEEVYIVLSDGEWRQASGPWHQPGIGGLVYNPPNIVHAMRSTDSPLLALWFLWTEQSKAGQPFA